MHNYKLYICIALLCCCFSYSKTLAQDFILGPSTSTMDSKAVFANPAIVSFQPAHISMGVKAYHTGFFEDTNFGYRQGFFTVTNPRIQGSRFGAAFNIQYFNSPIFKRSQTGGTATVELLSRVSFGFNASVYHVGYNMDNFSDDFDFSDPVFADGSSRFKLNTSAGIYARPIRSLEIAGGARNLNEPDLSLTGNNAPEPMELFSAISYNYGMFRGTLELINKPTGIENRTHVEVYSSLGYYARLGTNMSFNSGYLEAQAHVYGGVSVNYQFELPMNELAGNTSGSHMFSLKYSFNRIPRVPAKIPAVSVFPSGQRNRTSPEIPPVVLLNTETDHAKIREINLIRNVDETSVRAEDIIALSMYDFGVLENISDLDFQPYGSREPTSDFVPESVEYSVSITDQYQETIDFLKHLISDDEFDDLQIVIEEGEANRAAGLRNELRRDEFRAIPVMNLLLMDEKDSTLYRTPFDINKLGEKDQLVFVNPATARIEPVFIKERESTSWRLLIFDEERNMIRQIEDRGQIPEVIEWDWTNDDGELIEPGLYRYHILWTDSNGTPYESRSKSLYVQKLQRNIMIDITKDIDKIIPDPDRMDIILKNN